ncbi:hypothetical protein BDZ94DRAFT_1310471 [Collybia nuda]|uniref:Uncharacterized protein n=1 Tax=Collybia nuda TaxID=64659 RepID=A0A9P6CI61_9AGAR|nr:hypothetical protein BDZ94DRAFT_1310471 [Collybia nuda]
MKFNIPLTFFIFPVVTYAATITFFGVKETASTPGPPYPTGSITYRPIGVGADGATTYAEEYVWSEYLQWSKSKYTSGGSIQTADSPTTTVTVPPQTFRGKS